MKKVLIHFGLNLMKCYLRMPFEDQAERCSIEIVEQEIKLPMQVHLELRGRDEDGLADPARPSDGHDLSSPSNGQADHVVDPARPSAELDWFNQYPVAQVMPVLLKGGQSTPSSSADGRA
ncbi:hypothetical protein F2Q69_00035008 [Brassica cretica]|uniref:Uncharacterized protein n=1 Tax=Brassica cretica TaxID=69181 RepID=A0A8S9SP15_BRACR|nr:hypothetical protein F2Q69_00035008 [Brassica cretica]